MIDLQAICFITVTITCGYETPVFSINLFGVFFQLLKGHGHNLSWKFFNFIFQFKCWQSFTIKEFVMVNQNWMSGEQLQMRYRANNSLLYMNKSKLLTCFCIQILYNHVYIGKSLINLYHFFIWKLKLVWLFRSLTNVLLLNWIFQYYIKMTAFH